MRPGKREPPLGEPGRVELSWACQRQPQVDELLVHGEGAAVTHREDTMGRIPWVGQGCGPMQAPAQHDGKLWRFTCLGGQRVVPEQRAWRGREGKGVHPARLRI